MLLSFSGFGIGDIMIMKRKMLWMITSMTFLLLLWHCGCSYNNSNNNAVLAFSHIHQKTSSSSSLSFRRSSSSSSSPSASFITSSKLNSAAASNNDSDDSLTFAENAITISESISSLIGQTIVVKYGGNAMTSPYLAKLFCQDVATLQKLGIRVIVVHGGGPQIKSTLQQMNIESKFENGMRVSTTEVVHIAEMVLSGSVNKDIVSNICSRGGRAIGLSGRDDQLLICSKLKNDDNDSVDLGFVGKVDSVNVDLLEDLLEMGLIPVISPIGTGPSSTTTTNHADNSDDDSDVVAYNVNADVAAGRIAGEIRAARVYFLTDIAGVLDKNKVILPKLTVDDIQSLIENETITGGMIPKVTYAVDAVKLGVGCAFITDGRKPHALLNEVLSSSNVFSNGNGVVVDDDGQTGTGIIGGTVVTL